MASGQTYTVAATTTVSAVTIEQGGVLTAPAGYSLTMTVNGVETGQVLAATSGADTVFVPGSWRGDIVLTVTEADDITWQQHVYPFRQAIYADSTGLVSAYSVLAAAVGGQVTNAGAYGVRITSTGQCFDGVFVNGGSYALERPVINLNGSGRCDFVGYGAALVANNTGTTVVVDGAADQQPGRGADRRDRRQRRDPGGQELVAVGQERAAARRLRADGEPGHDGVRAVDALHRRQRPRHQPAR